MCAFFAFLFLSLACARFVLVARHSRIGVLCGTAVQYLLVSLLLQMCRNIIVFSIILCDDYDLQMANQIIDDQRQAAYLRTIKYSRIRSNNHVMTSVMGMIHMIRLDRVQSYFC
jgi:hypothetical protein